LPHMIIEYSDSLSGFFDRRRFALELHSLTAKVLGTGIGDCKTRFRCADEVVIADGTPGHALIHVEIAILPGRAPETKAALSRAVLDLVMGPTIAVPYLILHASVEVRDLSAAYLKQQSILRTTEEEIRHPCPIGEPPRRPHNAAAATD
jgi:5-carboxymethyl-2-hydroxymuconate isomerase